MSTSAYRVAVAAEERVARPSRTPLTVRHAEPDDVPWLVVEMRRFAECFGSERSLFPDDEATATAIVTGLVQTSVFLVAERGWACPVGFIAGTIAPHPYNPKIRVLSESFWWVMPEWRGSRAGLLLLEQFIAFGEQHADWIHCTLEAKSPVNERTLTKRGFTLFERAYLREVRDA